MRKRLPRVDSEGYLGIGTVRVHRVVAERMLGRSLEPGEVVHHKDGDRLNNSEWNRIVHNQAYLTRPDDRELIETNFELREPKRLRERALEGATS